MKFDRKYSLSIETSRDAQGNPFNTTIERPITCEFSIQRNNAASANTATFKLYNLAEKTRNAIFKDAYAVQDFRAIQFRAGYGSFTPLCFNGSVKSAQSSRNGVDMVTEIECYDGGFQQVNGFISTTAAGGQSNAATLKTLCDNLPQLSGSPIIGSFPTVSTRGEVLFGNTWGLIATKSGGLCSIDNNQVKVLNDDEAFPGEIPLITSESGLLESPRRSSGNNFIEVNMLFEPRFTVGQIVQLQTSTNSIFNGTFKVVGFEHSGTISSAVGGGCKTTLQLFRGTGVFKTVAANVVSS